MWVIYLAVVGAMILFAYALAKAAGKPMSQHHLYRPMPQKPRSERTQTEEEVLHDQENNQGDAGCDPSGNSLVQNQDVAAQPGAPVGKVSDTVTWVMICFLAIFSGCIVGMMVGWKAQVQTDDHRYIRALAARHEAEARYWTDRLEETIQENKGRIARKEEQ